MVVAGIDELVRRLAGAKDAAAERADVVAQAGEAGTATVRATVTPGG